MLVIILLVVLYLMICANLALRYPGHKVPTWVKAIGLPGLLVVWFFITLYLLAYDLYVWIRYE